VSDLSEHAPATPVPPAGVVAWQDVRHFYQGLDLNTFLRPLPEHDLIYVKNPKAGCSTILLWLDRMHTGEYDVELGNIHKNHRLPRLQDVGRNRVARMLSGSAYRFSFVRSPLRRFESVYWNKLLAPTRFLHRAKTSLGLPIDSDAPVSFEEFLDAVEKQDPVNEMDPHWRPQHVNLLHPLISYDHVGKLENFDSEIARITEEAGLPEVPFQVRNVTRRQATESVYDGRPDLVRRVEQIYAQDFELYGY
jgi:hypothetical protein